MKFVGVVIEDESLLSMERVKQFYLKSCTIKGTRLIVYVYLFF